MRHGVIVAILAALSASASGAAAQQQMISLAPKLDPVWQKLGRNNAKFLSVDQQALLDDLGFAAAAADGCPDITLDRQAFERGFEDFKTAAYMKLSPDEKRRFEYHLMMNFGATTALYSAEGFLHPKDACKLAESRRDAGPGRFWVKPAAAPPAP